MFNYYRKRFRANAPLNVALYLKIHGFFDINYEYFTSYINKIQERI